MDVTPEAYRRARWAVSAVFFIDGALLGVWAAHIPTLQHKLELTPGQLGLALLASPIGAVLTMPFASYWIHRFGSRNVGLVCGVALSIVVSVLLLPPTLATFAAVLFCLGVTNGQFDVSMNSHSVVLQERFRRPILSAVHGWFSVGGFAGGASAAIAARIGVTPEANMAGCALVIGTLLIVATRFMLPPEADKNAEGVRFALPVGPLAVLGALALFAFIAEGAIWDWAAVYLRNVLSAGAALGSLGFGLFSFGMAAGRFVGDSAIHRFGPRGVLAASAALAAVGIWMSLAFSAPEAAIVGFTLAGFGLANVVPILFRAAGSVPGIPTATGLAAVTTCGYTGFLLGPPAVGFLAQGQSLGFALGAIAVLCILIAALGPRSVVRRD